MSKVKGKRTDKLLWNLDFFSLSEYLVERNSVVILNQGWTFFPTGFTKTLLVLFMN